MDSSCWCGELRARVCFRTPRFGLIQCQACGSYHIDPPAVRSPDEGPSFYTRYYATLPHDEATPTDRTVGQASRFWRIARQVPSLLQPGRRALDIGCGDGQLCAELAAAGWASVTGVDVSAHRIATARARFPDLAFYDRPLEATPVPPGCFDLVVMDNVIEHVPEPLGFLRGVRRYLATDGRLVLATPNMRSGHFRLLGRRWTPELAPHVHIYLFTDASLRTLLESAGFAVDHAGTFQLPPTSWSAWLRKVKSGSVKEIVWSIGQEAGAMYGRALRAGPMLYATAHACE